ncbi:unnamed protein product [Allacma fusca]|uniref:Aldehyde dehydrogenase n=1 Tax=Allacma fusca TaxID=39272 RepID=A0A8J2KCW7_9HEXA|nr:unnamed protein product [Allacma fusca]
MNAEIRKNSPNAGSVKMDSKNDFNSGLDVLAEAEIEEIVLKTRDAFNNGVTLNVEFRRKQLQNLKRMFAECESQIMAAQYKDLRKGFYTAKVADIVTVRMEIESMLRNLKEYTTDEKLPFNVGTALDKACADIMAQLLPKYLDQSCYHVVTGGVETSKRLLQIKFDYIFFTGSQTVGKSVMQAASQNLTPVTLELGGMNPCYIHPSADVMKSTKKILWGKLFVGGQLCIAPDFLMCSEDIQAVFISSAKKFLREWYGTNAQKSPDLVRIAHKQHFNRLKRLLETTKGKIVIGGQTDEDDMWIEPTIVVNVDPDNDALMQEEIFGPILPIVTVSSVQDAIRIMRSKPKPLCSYVFATSQAAIQQVKESTSSGCLGINDVLWQSFRPGLPFGGVGASGMGKYHGKYSFDTFSHDRAILEISQDIFTENIYEMRYPPYTKFKCEFLTWMGINYELLSLPLESIIRQFLSALIGVLAAFAFIYFYN